MVILREDPSQIAKLRHPFCALRRHRTWELGVRASATMARVCRLVLPMRQNSVRGASPCPRFDVLQAKFALFVRSSVAIETERLVVMSGENARAVRPVLRTSSHKGTGHSTISSSRSKGRRNVVVLVVQVR
jgi:hypothetical protein